MPDETADPTRPVRVFSRDWLALLPWANIYALGVIVVVALMALLTYVASRLF